jgi:hypothetical protein
MPLAVDIQGGVSSAWSNVITFVPKLAAALVIILVGAAAYADPVTQEFAAERTSRLRRDR